MNFQTIGTNVIFVRESPFVFLPSAQPVWSITVSGSGTLVWVVDYLYEGKTDVSSTKLANLTSVSGRVLTSRTCQNLVGGSEYVHYFVYTDNGKQTERAVSFSVLKRGVL